jgi:hypothetical protein
LFPVAIEAKHGRMNPAVGFHKTRFRNLTVKLARHTRRARSDVILQKSGGRLRFQVGNLGSELWMQLD